MSLEQVRPFNRLLNRMHLNQHSGSNRLSWPTKGNERMSLSAEPMLNSLLESRCGVCQRSPRDPRILPCLHVFCTTCLIQLANGKYSDIELESNMKITCSKCESMWPIPIEDGVESFPRHYILQHKQVLSRLNQEPNWKILCDICTQEKPATHRCDSCALSLCSSCSSAHGCSSALIPLGRGVHGPLRIEPLCSKHDDQPLTRFCLECRLVICDQCLVSSEHRSHACEAVNSAAPLQIEEIKKACRGALNVSHQTNANSRSLNILAERIEQRCLQVEQEINNFISTYIQAIELHRDNLIKRVREARDAKLQSISHQRELLQKRAQQTKHAVSFADEIIRHGGPVEVLSLLEPVLSRLVWCSEDISLSSSPSSSSTYSTTTTTTTTTTSCSRNTTTPLVADGFPAQLLPEGDAGVVLGHRLHGVLVTRTLDVTQTSLESREPRTEAFSCRVHRRAQFILVARDEHGEPLGHNGITKIFAEARYRDSIQRRIPVQVVDRTDGTFSISFTTDVPGNISLDIMINGQHVKGSPYRIASRIPRRHSGRFHCCCFCSSSGNKEAVCACPGQMPGGYKGCGHGHDGHPGRRHWSCCANVIEHSECTRSTDSYHSPVYHYTL